MAILKMTKREITLAELVTREELKKAYVGGRQWTDRTGVTGIWCIPPTFERLVNWNPTEEYRGWQNLPEESRNWRMIWQDWINHLITEARKQLRLYDMLEKERQVLAEFLENQNELLTETRNLCRSLEWRTMKYLEEAGTLYALARAMIRQSQKSSCPWKIS